MDSEVQRDGRILDLIDDAWREDKLPYEDVAIPLSELPNEASSLSLPSVADRDVHGHGLQQPESRGRQTPWGSTPGS